MANRDGGAPTGSRPTVTVVLAGVAGVGKSSLLAVLAPALGAAALEGDDLHAPADIARMQAGTPLTDEDRWPWLRRIAAWIGEREAAGTDAVVACSALRRPYRDVLRAGHPSVVFVQLTADAVEIDRRMTDRPDHFMPESLAASQAAVFEALADEERGLVLRADRSPTELAVAVVAWLHEHAGRQR